MDNFMLPRLFCQNSEWNLTLIDICWKFTVFPSSPLVIYCFVVVFDYSSLVSPFGEGISLSLSFSLLSLLVVVEKCAFRVVLVVFLLLFISVADGTRSFYIVLQLQDIQGLALYSFSIYHKTY